MNGRNREAGVRIHIPNNGNHLTAVTNNAGVDHYDALQFEEAKQIGKTGDETVKPLNQRTILLAIALTAIVISCVISACVVSAGILFKAANEELKNEQKTMSMAIQDLGTKQMCISNDWIYVNRTHYYLHNRSMNNKEAQAFCASINAAIVFVETLHENKFLQNKLRQAAQGEAWMAITDEGSETNFYKIGDISKARLTFTDWYNGEPNNEKDSENCAVFRQRFNYLWNDVNCGELHFPLCESKSCVSH